MKPRERKEQAQSSRLYLRNKDHREVIFNDMYHNAMWANVGNIHDELVWVKYPKKALMHRVKPFTGWIDVDRQFCYGMNLDGQQRSGSFYRLRNNTVIYYGAYSGLGDDNCYAIEDGIIWHDISSKITSFIPYGQPTFYIGEDTMAYLWGDDYWHGGGDKKHINWTRIYKDDEGEFQVEQKSYTLDCDTSWINWYTPLYFVGTINDTAIVIKENVDRNLNCQQWFFSIDKTGHVEMISDPVPQITWMAYVSSGGDKFVSTQKAKRLFFATSSTFSHDQYQHWSSQVVAWMSMDGGRTWTKEVLYGGDTLPDYNPQAGNNQNRIEMFQRDGEVFLLFGQASNKDGTGWHEVHLFSTLTGTSWSEIPLPKWVDLPVLNEYSGQGVSPASKDTLRIAIRPNETSGQDYNMFDLLEFAGVGGTFFMDYDHGNLMFKDGKLVDLLDEEFYMVIGSGSLHLYFDNRYMAESSKAFAWFTREYNSQLDGADYIQNGDYCVAYNPVPFDPSPYAFWDYYIYVEATQEYVKVARITLPYYSEYYLVVVEYLPQVGANNVLYKVPRYNV